jgi:hypothetical protein
MKKIAIKGHATRGKEVIELLEMLGGHNVCRLNGREQLPHWVADNNYICNKFSKKCKDILLTFTLEEFLEKYPFKVGELKDLLGSNLSCVISEMRWNAQAECVEYHATFGLNDYGWHKVSDFCSDYQIEELNTVISGINLNSCDYADEVELNLGDYEIKVRDGRTFAVLKKPKYPKTFEECLNMLYCKSVLRTIIGHKAELLFNLEKLLICRDAYWKIVGEQMGLGKLWEPQFESCKTPHYCIFINYNGKVRKDCFYGNRCILAFPTEEMRDAFYENFKDLIESCKELL